MGREPPETLRVVLHNHLKDPERLLVPSHRDIALTKEVETVILKEAILLVYLFKIEGCISEMAAPVGVNPG